MRAIVNAALGTTWVMSADGPVRNATMGTHHSYEEWLAEVVSRLRTLFEPAGAALEVSVVLTGSLQDNKLVSIGGEYESWAGRNVADDIAAALGIEHAYALESATALLLGELGAQEPWPQIAVVWDLGITGAVTTNNVQIEPLALGHLLIPSMRHSCPCRGTGCINEVIGGARILADYDSLEDVEDHQWQRYVMLLTEHVLAPLAITRPGRHIVLGGEVFMHMMAVRCPVFQWIHGYLPSLVRAVTPPRVLEPVRLTSIIQGAQTWMRG